MKQYQMGEAMLAMLLVMLVVVGLSGGHMGMMGHGSPAPEQSASPNNKQGETSEHRR